MDCFFLKKPIEIKKVTKTLAATAAENNGAINIWIDDDGNFRCESMRFFQSLEKQIYDDINDAKTWARKWLSEIK